MSSQATPPPSQIQVLDLRLLVNTMLAPFSETRVDWRAVKFLGSESGAKVLDAGLKQLDAAGGIGSGKGSGDAAALASGEAGPSTPPTPPAPPADPEDEPPPLT